MSTKPLLLIDAGNSRLKWQLIHQAQPQSSEQRAVGGSAVGRALADPVISVANAAVTTQALLTQWRKALSERGIPADHSLQISWVAVGPISIRTAVTEALGLLRDAPPPAPLVSRAEARLTASSGAIRLVNHYHRPEQLGADRWCAALGLAALAQCPVGQTHLIISAGTATTVDLIQRSEVSELNFCGGWILPGVQLMVASLQGGTQALDYALAQSALSAGPVPGESQQAITQGVGLAQAGFIAPLAAQHGVTKIWLYGGNALFWKEALRAFAPAHPPLQEIPQLLFAGLAAAALTDDPH
jgi:pantothenate kinase type III